MSLPDFDFNDHHWHGVGTRECRETSGSPRTAFECGKSAPSAPCCTDVMHRLSMQDLFLLGQARGWGGGSTSYCLLPYNPFQKRMSFQFGRRKKNKRMKTFVELQTAATKEPEAEVEDEEDDEDGGDMSKYKLDSDEVRAFFFPRPIIHAGFKAFLLTQFVPAFPHPATFKVHSALVQKGRHQVFDRLPSEGDPAWL